MESKITKFIKRLELEQMCCPICQSDLYIEAKAVICQNNHTFNINKKGYLNFEPQKHLKIYDVGLFEARHKILKQGYYQPLVNELKKILNKYQLQNKIILDVGCGEGSFLADLYSCDNINYGLDLSHAAIKQANLHHSDLTFMVADVAALPFKNETVGVIIDILTPANYREFSRVLAHDGLLLKVIPNSQYLIEIKKIMGINVKNDNNVLDKLKEYATIIEEQDIIEKINIASCDRESLLCMTPLTSTLNAQEFQHMLEKLPDIITIDLKIVLAGMKKD